MIFFMNISYELQMDFKNAIEDIFDYMKKRYLW